mgnify:CR=1 FL=1
MSHFSTPGAEDAIDFGRQSDDYVRHRPGFPASFFDKLQRFVDLACARALDVGTGPGVVALDLAERGAIVVGLDVSANQIAAATEQAKRRNLTATATFAVARAEQTGQPDAAFDIAVAGQCWIWFDEPAAVAEMLRVLRPGGLLVVAHFCYLPLHSDVANATEQLVIERNPTWQLGGHTGLYERQIDPILLGGFELVEQFCYDHDQPFSHADWRGRVRTCNGVGSGIFSDQEVASFDRELADLLRRDFPREPLMIKHRVWATVARKPT